MADQEVIEELPIDPQDFEDVIFEEGTYDGTITQCQFVRKKDDAPFNAGQTVLQVKFQIQTGDPQSPEAPYSPFEFTIGKGNNWGYEKFLRDLDVNTEEEGVFRPSDYVGQKVQLKMRPRKDKNNKLRNRHEEMWLA